MSNSSKRFYIQQYCLTSENRALGVCASTVYLCSKAFPSVFYWDVYGAFWLISLLYCCACSHFLLEDNFIYFTAGSFNLQHIYVNYWVITFISQNQRLTRKNIVIISRNWCVYSFFINNSRISFKRIEKKPIKRHLNIHVMTNIKNLGT